MARPGITINTTAAAAAATPGQRLGTFFVAAQTERGPLVPDFTAPMYSLGDYAALYGSRNATLGSVATTYDLLDAFWRAGGGPVLLARVVGPAAVSALLSLQDRAGTPLSTLRVNAKGPGIWANTHVKVAIANGTASNTFVVSVLIDNVVTEVSPDLTSPSDAVTWSTGSRYVTITDLASATAAPNNIPAVLAATSLATGADDLASVTDTHWTAALNTMPASWGPGLVAKLGIYTAAGHAGTVAHAAASNRLAVLDGAPASSQATLTSLATTVQAAATAPEYAAVFAPWLTIPPAAGGAANRLVPPSSTAAGLISRQVTNGPANIAAAGANGVASYALDVQSTFTDTERDTLNGTAAVNVFRRPYSSSLVPPVELYGYATLWPSRDGWRTVSSQLLRLRLIDELTQIAENFVFDQLDGRGLKLAEFNAALRGPLQAHFDSGELYGATPAEAYSVDTTSVNTPTTLNAGQLNARVGIRVSPLAEQVFIEIAKFPITQSIVSAA
jgi:hypothetical protein